MFFSRHKYVPKRRSLPNVVLVCSGAMLCVMLMIPLPVYLLCRLDCAVKTKVPLSTVWTDLLSLNLWTDAPNTLDHILFACYCFIPLAAAVSLCIWMIVRVHRRKTSKET